MKKSEIREMIREEIGVLNEKKLYHITVKPKFKKIYPDEKIHDFVADEILVD
jgi:hypothetical protein